jgi:hypothetical protein
MIRRILKALGLVRVEYRKVEIFTTLKNFDDKQESYWVALSHLSNSDELRFCLHCMEQAVIAEIENGTAPGDSVHSIEHKAGTLFGIRQVSKMLVLSRAKVREYQIQKMIEADNE